MNNYITPIYAGGQVVGSVNGKVFSKRVRSSTGFLKTPPAICLDVQSLKDAMKAGAQWVHILDTDTGKTYRAHVDTIRKRSKWLDRGHGAQYALALGKWQVDNPKITHTQLSLLAGMSA